MKRRLKLKKIYEDIDLTVEIEDNKKLSTQNLLLRSYPEEFKELLAQVLPSDKDSMVRYALIQDEDETLCTTLIPKEYIQEEYNRLINLMGIPKDDVALTQVLKNLTQAVVEEIQRAEKLIWSARVEAGVAIVDETPVSTIKLVNTSPHEICFFQNGERKFVLNCTQAPSRCRRLHSTLGTYQGVDLDINEYENLLNLPAPEPGTIYIASKIVALAAALEGRDDVIYPDNIVTDPDTKQIVGCTSFARIKKREKEKNYVASDSKKY